MKNLLLLIALVFATGSILAQAPEAFKYQAVVRDNSGNIIQNQSVSFRISIHNATAGGTILYQETHTKLTNQFGLATLEIGTGTPVSGTFPGIDWSNGAKFLETELDPNGGSAYVSVGTSEILSVPFALHAANAHWDKSGSNIFYNSGNVGVGTASPLAKFHAESAGFSSQLVSSNNAVYGQHSISGSYGWLGASNNGAFGHSGIGSGIKGSTEDGYAIHGTVAGTGYGGYFEGNGYFEGDLGIGTTNPQSKLDVDGTISALLYLGDGSYLTGTGDNLGNHTATQNLKLNNHYLSGDGGNEGIFVSNLGKVGVGTNNPGDALLDVHGNINMNVDTDLGISLRFREGGSHRWTFLYRPWVNSTLTLLDEVGSKSIMVFEPNTGHIGINNTNPEVPLHILGGTDLTMSSGGHLVLGALDGANLVMDNNGITSRNNGATTSLQLNKDGGNVGIGSIGLNLLDVRGLGTQNGGVAGYDEVVAHFKSIGFGHSAVSFDAENTQDAIIYLSENGSPRWSIRTDVSDDINVSVKNWLEFRDHIDDGNQAALEIYKWFSKYKMIFHGDIQPSVSGSYFLGLTSLPWNDVFSNNFSTISEKSSQKNSNLISYGLSDILLLNPISYEKDNQKGVYSSLEFDPEDLAKLIPEAVVVPEETDENWGIRYNQLIPVLVKAIQDQQSQIDELQEQLSALQKQ